MTKLVKTGIDGLDEMLSGGIPEGKLVLVCGGPGTGKTILTLQCLMKALGRGEKCVFATLEESLSSIRKNALNFGWDLEAWEKKGQLKALNLFTMPNFLNVNARDRENGDSDLSIINAIVDNARRTDSTLVAVDPLTSLVIHEPRSGRKRQVIGELFEGLRSLGCTALIISETAPQEGDFYMEQFLADGVILLEKNLHDYKLVKTLRIDKMRGMEFDENPRRYIVATGGFQVFSREPVIV